MSKSDELKKVYMEYIGGNPEVKENLYREAAQDGYRAGVKGKNK